MLCEFFCESMLFSSIKYILRCKLARSFDKDMLIFIEISILVVKEAELALV